MSLRKILSIAAASLLASAANAGFLQPAPVQIDLDNMAAQGDMASARFSNNDLEYIGCGTRAILNADGTLFTWGFCQARTTEDDQITCFAFDNALVDKMNNANDYSFVTFRWTEEIIDNGDGTTSIDRECSYVGSSTQSFYLPELRDGNHGSGNNGNGNGGN